MADESAVHHGLHRRRRPSGEPPPLPKEFNKAAIAWLVGFVFWAAIWVWVFVSSEPAVWITRRDLELMAPIVDNRADWLTPTMKAVNRLGTHWASAVVGWSALIGALYMKRIRHALILITSLTTVAVVDTVISTWVGRPRPLGFTVIGEWEGFAQPSRPVALLAASLVGLGLTLLGKRHRAGWNLISAAVLVVFGFAQIYTAVDHPSDVFAGATVGIAATLVLFRTLAPERVFAITYQRGNTAHLDVTGARGEAIVRGLRRQLGMEVSALERIGLAGSSGSTPLLLKTSDGTHCFGKLYARSHLRSDRSYKLGRTLLYGRLEDEQHFSSVRRLVQQEDYMLHLMHRVGVPGAAPRGIVEITPDREYLLVTEFLDGAQEISEADIDEAVIDEGLEAVAILWRSGLAHRDIKPANVMIHRGHLKLIDVAFAQVRPSPWRQAVDLANMMLVLALRSSPELVYERAQLKFSDSEIAEAFAASRGVTLPSQLRRDVRDDGRELLHRFRELAPRRDPVSIQRWSLRRVGLTAWVALVAVVVASIFVSNLADIGLR